MLTNISGQNRTRRTGVSPKVAEQRQRYAELARGAIGAGIWAAPLCDHVANAVFLAEHVARHEWKRIDGFEWGPQGRRGTATNTDVRDAILGIFTTLEGLE